MSEGVNPVIPGGWEILVQAVGLCHLVLVIAAVLFLARDRTLAPGVKFLCLLGILAFPLLGPAAWFLHLFRSRRIRRAAQAAQPAPAATRSE